MLPLILLFLSAPSYAEEFFYIGDSHSYLSSLSAPAPSRRFGHVLLDGMKAKRNTLTYFAACGSSPRSWAEGGSTRCGYSVFEGGTFHSAIHSPFPSVAKIFPKERPLKLLVNLGDNMFLWAKVNGKMQSSVNPPAVRKQLGSFFAQLPPTTEESCAWIGPTYHREGSAYRKTNAAVDTLYLALAESLKSRCRLIDSRPMVIPQAPNDGLHHVNVDSRAWAEGVLKAMEIL